MGGRGGYGRTQSSRTVHLTLPTLTGSEKQVSWANDIRTEITKNADHIVKSASSPIGLFEHGNRISADGAKAMRSQIYDMLSKISDAKQIINFKQNYRDTYDFLSRWAEQETKKRKK